MPPKVYSAFRKQKDDGGLDGESSLDWNGSILGSWVPSFWAGSISLKRAHNQPVGRRAMSQ